MSDGGDELLLERDHTVDSCNAIVTVLRSLMDHPGYKLMAREIRLREKIAVAALSEVDPDKPGRVGKLQGAALTLHELAAFAGDAINELNEKREQLKQDAAALLVAGVGYSTETEAPDDPQETALPRRPSRRLATV